MANLLLRPSAEQLFQIAATMSPALDRIEVWQRLKALPVSVAILDDSGTIIAVNESWKEFGRNNGLKMPRFGVGASYLRYCRSDEPSTSGFASRLRLVLARRLDLLTFVYPCHSVNERRWFCLIALPLSLGEAGGVALLHVDLTGMLGHLAAAHVVAAGQSARIGSAIRQSAIDALSAQLGSMVASSWPASRRPGGPTQGDGATVVADRLSRRQLQILRLLGKGKSNKEIAGLLSRSPNTIKLHVSEILRRLKVKSRTEAAVLAARLNETELLASPVRKERSQSARR